MLKAESVVFFFSRFRETKLENSAPITNSHYTTQFVFNINIVAI